MGRMYKRFISAKKLHPGARFWFSIDVKTARDYRILKRRVTRENRRITRMILDYRSRVMHRPQMADSENSDYFPLPLPSYR